jgi:uncharacterized membrane protein YeiB
MTAPAPASASTPSPAHIASAPISKAERSLAPDLARGFMLLFIAIANVPVYLHAQATNSYGMLANTAGVDQWVLTVEKLLVADRSRPMFAILYGFGMAMMASRLLARAEAAGAPREYGVSRVRVLLAKRSVWLIALGVLHAVFLFMGDILAPYGVTGLIVLAFITMSTRVIAWVAGASFAYLTLIGAPAFSLLSAWGKSKGEADFDWPEAMPAYVASMLEGAFVSISAGIASVIMLMFVPLVLAGVLLHRAGWLTSPGDHLRALRLTFGAGTVVGIGSAVPIAMIAMGAWEPGVRGFAFAWWLTLTGGAVAGLAYIALFALIGHRLQGYGRRGVVRAIAALGERSLSGYLAQSFIAAPLMSAWGFAVGAKVGYAGAFLVALGIWLVTVVIAYLMDKAGKRGPFEVLLRRLVYGRAPAVVR